MDMKAWYQSKTVWLNLATFLALALMVPEVGEVIPPWMAKYVAAGNALLNLALRLFGTQTATIAMPGRSTTAGLLLLVLLPFGAAGCALKGGARHTAVLADAGIHASLSALQDAELAMFRAGVPEVVAHHQAFSADLVPVLETGDAINRLIRDWPVDKPAPAELPLLASRLQGLTRTIARNWPESEAKSRLLTRAFAVSDVVLTLLLTLPPATGSAPMLAPVH